MSNSALASLAQQENETLNTYQTIAEGWTAGLRKDFWEKEYAKFSQLLPKGKVIDIGCGSGRESLWFTGHKYEYVGIDFSSAMVEIAKKANPKATFEVKSFYDLDFPLDSFDGFWASCSLVHAPREKVAKVLEEIRNIVKPGGIGFVAVKEGKGEQMEE